MAPAVSIITPTFKRHALLEAQHAIVMAQTVQDFEWLILDDGPEPCRHFAQLSDPRIRYTHLGGAPMLVSAKRNWLCERAAAPVIAQFDDDDYYAPRYLATMLARLEQTGADITKLSGWFVYSAMLKRLGWWDTANTLGLHFTFGPEPVLNAFFNQTAPDNMKNNYAGYGFSYVFKKSAWEKAPFPPVKYASDFGFVSAAMAKGCRLDHFADTDGLCLHVLRKDNMSKSFPQYLLPDFMLQKLFPADLSPLLNDTTVRSPIYKDWFDAIRHKRRVRYSYEGERREGCPHVLGLDKDGREKVLVLRVIPGSDEPPKWRCLFLSRTANVREVKGRWLEGDSHKQRNSCVVKVHIDVNRKAEQDYRWPGE